MLLASRRLSAEPNLYHFVMDIAWFGLALATTTRFLSVYAIHLGATASHLAWMTALPALVMLIASTFTGWWRSRYANSQRAVFWPAVGFRLSFFLLALTPLLSPTWQPIWLIAVLTLTAIPQGIGGVIFLVLMRESVSTNHWNILNSRRHMAMNATIAIGALAAGIWLERGVFPLNYQVMFLVGFLATLISLWHVMRVKPIYTTPPTTTTIFNRDLWRSPGLWRIVLVLMLTHLPFFMVYPLVPLQLVHNLGATEGFIAVFGLAELAGGVLVAGWAARWIGQWGYRHILTGAMIGTGFAVGMIALTPALWMTVPAAVVLGASWTLVGIGIMSVMIEYTPPEDSTRYNTIFIQGIGLATFIGPLLGDALIATGLDLIVVLLVGAGVRVVAGWLLLVYHDRTTHTGQRPTEIAESSVH